MRRLAAVTALLTACTAAALAAPAGPIRAPGVERVADTGPDGLLVLAALSPERAIVADPRTGATRERELPGGTLCHGPLLALGDRVIVSGTRGGRPVALAMPLSLAGRGRSLGPADAFFASHTRDGEKVRAPDGRRLAQPVRRAGGGTRLAVVDIETDRWRLVPGARLGDYGAIAWSPSCRWLYFADARERVRAWRDGARRPVRLPFDPRGTVMSIAVLSRP
jgi:hypothetical protein